MDSLTQWRVKFNQGLIKTFIADRSTSLGDFVGAIGALGRFRQVTFLPDVTREAAGVLVRTGNAVLVEVRRQRAA